jgi:hypothetical protein
MLAILKEATLIDEGDLLTSLKVNCEAYILSKSKTKVSRDV